MASSDTGSLVELAEHGLDGDRRELASSADMSPALAKVLLKKGDQDTIYALASNPATPKPTLRKLSGAVRSGKLGVVFPRPVPRSELARRLAANPSLPGSELSQRLRNPRWDVRAAALLNPSLSPATLRQRIATEVWGVGATVAAATSDASLLEMLIPSSERIRLAIATNPNAPLAVLEALLEHEEPYVAAVIARHPALTYSLAQRIASVDDAPAWLLRALADNPALSGAHRDRFDEQADLAPGNAAFDPLTCDVAPDSGVDPDDWYDHAALQDGAQWSALWRVRAYVAARYTTAANAERFVIDPHPKVRLAALASPLSVAQINDLIDDTDAEVGLAAIAVHDALSEEQRAGTFYGRRPGKERRLRVG